MDVAPQQRRSPDGIGEHVDSRRYADTVADDKVVGAWNGMAVIAAAFREVLDWKALGHFQHRVVAAEHAREPLQPAPESIEAPADGPEMRGSCRSLPLNPVAVGVQVFGLLSPFGIFAPLLRQAGNAGPVVANDRCPLATVPVRPLKELQCSPIAVLLRPVAVEDGLEHLPAGHGDVNVGGKIP